MLYSITVVTPFTKRTSRENSRKNALTRLKLKPSCFSTIVTLDHTRTSLERSTQAMVNSESVDNFYDIPGVLLPYQINPGPNSLSLRFLAS